MTVKRLTPERLFSDPPLTSGAPLDVQFSPNGKYLSYRRAAADDRERMDLWRIDPVSGEHSLWIDARTLSEQTSDITELTAQERADRERRRQFSFGITQYSWHPDGEHLLIPNDGQALLVDVSSTDSEVKELCPTGTRQSGFTLSPGGHFLSYVRDGDLYVMDLNEQVERRITGDASETLQNGVADFLAAEEMHRFKGHWWSPCEEYIAFTKVDESPVRVSHRLEMDADGARTIEQRYPYAGEANPHIELWLINLKTSDLECIWRDVSTITSDIGADAYLARVTMDVDRLVIQTQDRLQQRLSYRSFSWHSREWHDLYSEQSDTWINLTDDLRILESANLLLTTEKEGTRQAFALTPQGNTVALLCPTHLNGIVGHDDKIVYATGWNDSPTENHLYALMLDGSTWRVLTREPGWHDVAVCVKSGQYVDRYSDERTPGSLNLCSLTDDTEPRVTYKESFAAPHPYADYLPHHAYSIFGEVTADDGQQLCYRLTPPAEILGKHATIVYVYGGPGPQKARREWSPLTVQLFAQNGFAVLEIDNRGTGNRGQVFEAPIYRNMSKVEVADQVAGLAALSNQSWADLGRVGLFGHSYGGYMTLMGLCQAATHFHAGVAVAPVSDWQLYDTHYTERFMGLPVENETGYESANVLTHLHKLSAPLLLMHGMADDNVLFTHSTLIMAELQRLGKPFDLMTYPGAKHSMQERDVSIHRFNMILEFFNRHLGRPSDSVGKS